MEKVTITLNLSEELKEKLKREAERKGISLNSLITGLLWKHLENKI